MNGAPRDAHTSRRAHPSKGGTQRRRVAGVAIAAVALGLLASATTAFIVQAFVVKPYRIPSQSMEPTLVSGERILVDRLAYHSQEPRRGDIVVFEAPEGTAPDGTVFISRIVGLPGDTVSIEGVAVAIDGKPLREPYAQGVTRPLLSTSGGVAPWSLDDPYVLVADTYFVLGDNREESPDSRSYGPVPRDRLVGRYWRSY